MKLISLAIIIIVMAAAPVVSEEKAGPPEWSYDAILYGWLSGLDGTIGIGEKFEQPVDATFDDLKGMVDFALAGHFEARNPQAVFLMDVSYTGLSSSRDAQIGKETVPVDLDLTQWIVELGGGFRPTKEFDVLFAWRYYILDMGATLTSTEDGSSKEGEQKWSDLFIGGRYSKLLREKWIVSIRGDVGAGGSDYALFANIAAGYQFTELVSALVSWRVLSLDREVNESDGSYFKYDVTQSGLGIGVRFSF